MSFKQYPVLFSVLGILGAVCAGGLGVSVWQYLQYSGTQRELAEKTDALGRARVFRYEPPSKSSKEGRALADLRASLIRPNELNVLDALKKPFTPNKDNLAAVEENRGEFVKLETDLYTRFNAERARRVFEGEKIDNAANLVTRLKASKQDLENRLKAAGVRLRNTPGSDFGFGFNRYVATNDGGQPKDRLDELLVQQKIITWLVERLIEAKDGKNPPEPRPKDFDNPLFLQGVRREPLEVTRDASNYRAGGVADEYTPRADETLRREGVMKSYYFRIVFTSRTDVLRRFVAYVRNEDTPLVFRSLSVAPANPNVINEEGAAGGVPDAAASASAPVLPAAPAATPALPGFDLPPAPGAAPAPAGSTLAAAAAPAKQSDRVVVADTPSEFVVSFEYLMPVPPQTDAAPAKP